jgi:hypothetical protein
VVADEAADNLRLGAKTVFLFILDRLDAETCSLQVVRIEARACDGFTQFGFFFLCEMDRIAVLGFSRLQCGVENNKIRRDIETADTVDGDCSVNGYNPPFRCNVCKNSISQHMLVATGQTRENPRIISFLTDAGRFRIVL